MKYIVVVGNLALVVGPFDSQREAIQYVAAVEQNPRWFGYTTDVVRIYEPSVVTQPKESN